MQGFTDRHLLVFPIGNGWHGFPQPCTMHAAFTPTIHHARCRHTCIYPAGHSVPLCCNSAPSTIAAMPALCHLSPGHLQIPCLAWPPAAASPPPLREGRHKPVAAAMVPLPPSGGRGSQSKQAEGEGARPLEEVQPLPLHHPIFSRVHSPTHPPACSYTPAVALLWGGMWVEVATERKVAGVAAAAPFHQGLFLSQRCWLDNP